MSPATATQVPRPRLLRPDNFTPPTRTPWGGRKILAHYKRDLPMVMGRAGVADALPRVGESWEISVEPSFPSRTADTGELLADVIAADPVGWLDVAGARRHGGQTPLLVKLLDAADNLSVQVHPSDQDPALGPDESGKIESWYVLETDPALAGDTAPGVYLGFRDGVGRSDVEQCLRAGGRLDALLSFVPVRPGDAFVIDAGTVHAIGAGVTLVEAQIVRPGRHGVTYRYWDWNRRYDEQGNPSAAGQPRPLHVERSLAATRWDSGHGAQDMAKGITKGIAKGVDRYRVAPRIVQTGALDRVRVIDWDHLVVERWAGSGSLRVPAAQAMLAMLCVHGEAAVRTESGARMPICRGESAVIPARAGEIEVEGRDTELLVTHAV